MLRGALPAWVEPDPLRSRATDALGLQEVADRIADRLLPGLSVLTTRARYFSFLAWARRETGNDHDERAIHRCELALVLAEARLSDEEPEHAENCRFVGSRNIRDLPRDRPPVDPRQVYKVPAWRAYRASMVALGLLEGAPRFALTVSGLAVARSFGAAVRARFTATKPLPARACLSEISPGERRQLRDLLGLSMRGRLDPEATEDRARRAAFALALAAVLSADRISGWWNRLHREERRSLRATIRALGHVAPVATYTGHDDRKEREAVGEAFRSPLAPWVLVASNVGSEGIDLHTFSAHLVHFDIEWNPARMEQREGRSDRVGRLLREPVNIYYVLVRGTYDERMLHQLVARQRWHSVLLGRSGARLARDRTNRIEAPLLDIESARKLMLNLHPPRA